MEGFATVEEALEELRNGKLILVTDDEDRENEGDFICAAEFATTENINFMAMHAKGLICMPMSAEYVKKLHFPQMVENNTDNHETAFTVSVDYVETTTGISAAERSMTAMRCVAEDAKPEDFRRPGHMFPLLAKKNGVLERNGHTEATVDLCRRAECHRQHRVCVPWNVRFQVRHWKIPYPRYTRRVPCLRVPLFRLQRHCAGIWRSAQWL